MSVKTDYTSTSRNIAIAPDASLWILDNFEFSKQQLQSDETSVISVDHSESCIQHFSADGHLLKRFKQYFSKIPFALKTRQALAVSPAKIKILSSTLVQKATSLGI